MASLSFDFLKEGCARESWLPVGKGGGREAEAGLVRSVNQLSVKVLHLLTRGSYDSLFFSPLSLASAFLLLMTGARADTRDQLRIALGLPAGADGDDEELGVQMAFQTVSLSASLLSPSASDAVSPTHLNSWSSDCRTSAKEGESCASRPTSCCRGCGKGSQRIPS